MVKIYQWYKNEKGAQHSDCCKSCIDWKKTVGTQISDCLSDYVNERKAKKQGTPCGDWYNSIVTQWLSKVIRKEIQTAQWWKIIIYI